MNRVAADISSPFPLGARDRRTHAVYLSKSWRVMQQIYTRYKTSKARKSLTLVKLGPVISKSSSGLKNI